MASPRFSEPTVTPSADVHHHRHHHGELGAVQSSSTYSTPVLLTSPVPYGSIMPTPTFVRTFFLCLLDVSSKIFIVVFTKNVIKIVTVVFYSRLW